MVQEIHKYTEFNKQQTSNGRARIWGVAVAVVCKNVRICAIFEIVMMSRPSGFSPFEEEEEAQLPRPQVYRFPRDFAPPPSSRTWTLPL